MNWFKQNKVEPKWLCAKHGELSANQVGRWAISSEVKRGAPGEIPFCAQCFADLLTNHCAVEQIPAKPEAA